MKQRDLFVQALEFTDAHERNQFLAEACSDDTGLCRQILGLLATYERAESFLELSPYEFVETQLDPTDLEETGTLIGRYKLLEVIGEGGMGTVYMAEQTEPVKRRVALKLIKTGMDTKQVIARFEAERQALAVMDHANIAKVLDAGATDAGRPYFVMELVKGTSITKFCDDQRLDTEARLALFQQVCQAVQHAHQKGVIHRDLKPANIMVAMYDDQPVPKVIDFGVAKATGEQLTEKTMFTRFGQVIGTLPYMSPEQAQFNQKDIDTRSDIYSLGAVLCELLSGQPPFDQEQLKSQALDETLRMIREDEPTKPSTKLSGAASLSEIASDRRIQPQKLRVLLQGDLDWIVMKSLEKDRSRRYSTASDFAEDVQNYLARRPVNASPPSSVYRFKRFAQRNKTIIAAGIFGLFAVSVGVMIAVAAYNREVVQRKLAQKNFRLAVESLENAYSFAGDLESEPELKPWQRNVLNTTFDTCARICQDLESQPEFRSELLQLLVIAGRVHQRLDRLQPAVDSFQRAIDIGQLLVGDVSLTDRDQIQMAKALNQLALANHDLGLSDGMRELQAARANWFDQLNRNPDSAALVLETVRNLSLIARAQQFGGQWSEALTSLETGQSICDRWIAQFGTTPSILGSRAHGSIDICRCLEALGKRDQAVTLAEETYELAKTLNTDRQLMERATKLLGNLLSNSKSTIARAESLLEKSTSLGRERMLAYPNNLANRANYGKSLSNLAALKRRLGKHDEARKLIADAVDQQQVVMTHAPDNISFLRDLADYNWTLGSAHLDLGRFQEAEASFEAELELREQIRSRSDSSSQSLLNLAGALKRKAKYILKGTHRKNNEPAPEAEDLLRRAVECVSQAQQRREDTPKIRNLASAINQQLARALVVQGKYDDAELVMNRALSYLDDETLVDVKTKNRLACTLNNVGMVFLIKSFEDDWPEAVQIAAAQSAETMALEAIALQPEAIAEAVSEFERKKFAADLARHYYVLGGALVEQEKYREGLAAYDKSIELDPTAQSMASVNYVAGLYLESAPPEFQNPQRGGELAKLVLEIEPKNRVAERWLAISLFRQQKYELARKRFQRWHDEEPDNSSAKGFLGMTLYRLGEFDQANEMLQKCYDESTIAGLYLVMAVVRSQKDATDAAVTKESAAEFYQYTLQEVERLGDATDPALTQEAGKVLSELMPIKDTK